MKNRGGGHAASGVFVFLLLGVFAVFSTLLVLLCAQAYHNTVDQTALHRDRRVIQSFIRNTLRAEDREGTVDSAEIEGIPALLLHSEDEDGAYIRYIYCDHGWLCDLFLEAQDHFAPELGEEICPAQGLSVARAGNLLTVGITDAAGEVYSFSIAQRCVR